MCNSRENLFDSIKVMTIIVLAFTVACGTLIAVIGAEYHKSQTIKSFTPSSCMVEFYYANQVEGVFETMWIPPICQVYAYLNCNNSKSIAQDLQCEFENCLDTERMKECKNRMETGSQYTYWFYKNKNYTNAEYLKVYERDVDEVLLPIIISTVALYSSLVVTLLILIGLYFVRGKYSVIGESQAGQIDIEMIRNEV